MPAKIPVGINDDGIDSVITFSITLVCELTTVDDNISLCPFCKSVVK